MSRHHSHIKSAVKAIETLSPGEPATHHLKKFFAADKKYGSKDRKAIAAICYNYFRLGNALKGKDLEEKILSAIFICSNSGNDLLEALRPYLNAQVKLPLEKKLTVCGVKAEDIFPFAEALSSEIDAGAFTLSFLSQPLFFLRMRPGKEIKVMEKFTEAKIPFEEISTSCIALQPNVKAEDLIKLNKDAVVQDRSSQEVFDYIKRDDIFLPKDAAVWDCCAASGGKSILLYDILHGHVQLTVSDIRENILHNLRNRFEDAGIKKYKSVTADLTKEKTVTEEKFDIIICDAPCTGSGTWARTPEQLSFFDVKEMDAYAEKQKAIASAAIESLKEDGLFFYITCSVFERENEAVVEYLKEKFRLQSVQTEYIKGYEKQADTMFTAVLKK